MSESDANFERWVLLEGNRHVVASALLVAIFVLLLALSAAGVLDLRDPATARGVGGGLIPGLFTFISIVLAINQLVLSQEFGSADEIRSRVRDVRGFRHEVETVAASGPSPILPTEFLALSVQAIGSKAAQLEATTGDEVDEAAEPTIDEFTRTVQREARSAAAALRRRDSGRINAVLSVLEYPESSQLHEARWIRAEYDDALSADSHRALDELVQALELFTVARTHFRTTYTQRVLARLSRRLLYVGVPALLASVALVSLSTDAALAPLWDYRVIVVAGLLTVALSPLALLFAYILRIATVSERTVGVGPFVSRPQRRDESTDDGRDRPNASGAAADEGAGRRADEQ